MNAKQGRNLAAIGAVIAYLLGLDGCRSGARAAASIGTCSPIPPSKPPPPPMPNQRLTNQVSFFIQNIYKIKKIKKTSNKTNPAHFLAAGSGC